MSSSGKRIRFGVVGTGVIARDYHLPVMAVNSRIELAAACDLDEFSAAAVSKRFGIPKIYPDFDQLAADPDLDAVLVSTPNFTHASIAIKILQGGKHVLCEKPMARSIGEAQAMLDAARTAQRVLAIAHPWRCDQDFHWLRDVVASGKLGKVFKIRCHAVITGNDPPAASWRCDPQASGGGALMDLGIHTIDTVSFLFGDKLHPARVVARLGNHFTATGVEDTATVMIEYRDGMLVVIDAGWHHLFQNAPHGALELYGSEGYARTFPTELHSYMEGVWTVSRPALHPDRPHIDLSMYAAQVDAFVDCLVSRVKPPCDARQGLRNVLLVNAAYQAARSGEPVTLQEIE